MVKPTIGRIVIYKYHDNEKPSAFTADECAAVIVRVHSDTCVNLRLIEDAHAAPPLKTSVVLGTQPTTWHWPERVE